MKIKKAAPARQALAFALSAALLVGTVGVDLRGKGLAADEVEFWSTYATEKILRDEYDAYASVRKSAEIKVQACRGEYESAQLIMTAKADVDAYTVEPEDLVLSGGEAVFPKENIGVYHEKYILVENIYDDNGAQAGWYPDALLPVETAAEYGENKIEKGRNQGLYVTFNVPVDQAAGVYNGTMKITCDGVESEIPVTLTVEDLLVSQTTHSKSKFNATFHHFLGELDNTQTMMDAYVTKMAEYRISPGYVVNGSHFTTSDEDMRMYVDKAYEMLQNPKMSNFNIPAFTASRSNVKTIDRAMLTKYIDCVLEKSLETGFDMMGRAIFSTGLIDEPDLMGLMDRVPFVCEDFKAAVTASMNNFPALANRYPEADPAFVAQLETSLENFPLVVSMAKTEQAVEMGVETFCPLINDYDSASSRAKYDDQQQRWWYTCINPRPPYPGYHMEDTLVSARSISWMMSEYDVIGNFFWAVDVYARYDGTSYQPIEDYYQTAARYPKANGDGFLFYPGSPYGLDEPVASLRLEAIRDGAEEYELFYDLKNIYGKLGFDTANIQRNISSLVYTGTQVASTSQSFYDARGALIDLVKLANTPAEVCVIDATDDNYGRITYKVYANDGYELLSDGKPVETFEKHEGGKIYDVSIDLAEQSNVNFGVMVDGELVEFDYRVGGKAHVSDAEAMKDGFTAGACSLETALTDASAVDPAMTGKLVELKLGATEGKHQSVNFTSDAVTGISASTKKIILRVYNPTEEDVPFMILAKFKGSSINVNLITTVLKPGENAIEVSGFGGMPWGRYVSLEYLAIYFTDEVDAAYPARSFYVKDFVTYDS